MNLLAVAEMIARKAYVFSVREIFFFFYLFVLMNFNLNII